MNTGMAARAPPCAATSAHSTTIGLPSDAIAPTRNRIDSVSAQTP